MWWGGWAEAQVREQASRMHAREAVAPDTPPILNVHAKAFGDEGAAIAELVLAVLHAQSSQTFVLTPL